MIVGLYFIIVMTFLHGSAGFTITLYKAAGLINVQEIKPLQKDKLMVIESECCK